MPPSPDSPVAAAPALPEGHRAPLWAADQFFGGFCVYMVVVATIAWARGQASPRTPLLILGYVIANFICSELLTRRVRRPDRAELFRMLVMTALNPLVYLLTDGPLALWWPGFLINALGQGIVLGLITRRAVWGTVLAIHYVALYALSTVAGVRHPDLYGLALHIGVIAMVTLLWAKVMSLLGLALRSEYDRRVELKIARDALFSEMEVAQRIQTLLLPRSPKLLGSHVHGRMLTATEVGGDYYDVIESRAGRRFLAIGDVSGHGVTSGLTMMMARASLVGSIEARPYAPLPDLYCALNRSLLENLQRMGVTLYMTFALIEHLGDGSFCAVGRHLPILLYRAASRAVEEVALDGDWLGLLDDLSPAEMPIAAFRLEKGDVMVLYTDGLVEHARGREMFGYDRLKDVLRRHATRGAEALADQVMAEVLSFGPNREDDMTLLIVDHRGEVAAAPTVQAA